MVEALRTCVTIGAAFGQHAWGKMYPRALFGCLGYPVGKYYEDQYVTYKAFMRADSIVYEDANDYCYRRKRPGSITTGDTTHGADSVEALREMLTIVTAAHPEAAKAVATFYQRSLMDALDFACPCRRVSERDALADEAMGVRPAALRNDELLLRMRLSYLVLARGVNENARVNLQRNRLRMIVKSLPARVSSARGELALLLGRGELFAHYKSRRRASAAPTAFLIMTTRRRDYGAHLVALSELRLIRRAGYTNIVELPLEDCRALGAKFCDLLDPGDSSVPRAHGRVPRRVTHPSPALARDSSHTDDPSTILPAASPQPSPPWRQRLPLRQPGGPKRDAPGAARRSEH